MKKSFRWRRTFALYLLPTAGAVITGAALWSLVSLNNPEPTLTDLSGLTPGRAQRIQLGRHEAIISVPKGEGYSIGTLQIEVPDLGFTSPAIERDGSPESVWIADVNADSLDDAVFVIRSAGSGAYASIVVLESAGKSFRVRKLPEVSGIPGYMGHEKVVVIGRTIRCSFPTYIDRRSPRVDRQWRLDDGLAGESPIKTDPDSNARPSGATKVLQYDYSTRRWEAR